MEVGYLKCEICGKFCKQKGLATHVIFKHWITIREYREMHKTGKTGKWKWECPECLTYNDTDHCTHCKLTSGTEIPSPNVQIERDTIGHISVRISGSDIYKAVSNHIRNSGTLQNTIKEKLAAVVDSKTWEKYVHDQTKEVLIEYLRDMKYHNSRDTLKNFIGKEIKEQLGDKIEKHVTKDLLNEMIKTTVTKMLIKD